MQKNITSGSLGRLAKRSPLGFLIFEIVTYLFILLFMYTAWSKIGSFASFSRAFIHSAYIGQYSSVLASAILAAEIGISVLLIVPASRPFGLLAALSLMLLFTGYLLLMFWSGKEMPCGCGGVINSMSWAQHIWFNSVWIVLATVGLFLYQKQKSLRA